MTNTSDASAWKVESMRFRFQLGESQFYARSYDVAVFTPRFLDITGRPEDVVLPLDTFRRKVAAFVILSHPISGPLPVVTLQKNFVRYASHQYRRGFIPIEGTFEGYLAGLSSNKRNQLKRKLKKFKERSGGTIRFEEFKEASRMREFHRFAREVSQKTYQEKLFKKGLPTDDAFLADMEARTQPGQDRARGWLLFDGAKVIAYLYAVIDEGFLTYDFVGYDPEASDLSPGNVLQYLILERVFETRACRIFDFGEGESQYKEFFSTASKPCADIYYFPRDARGYALAGSQAGLHYVSRTIVKALDKLGLKQKIKHMIRTGSFGGTPGSASNAEGVGGPAAANERGSGAQARSGMHAGGAKEAGERGGARRPSGTGAARDAAETAGDDAARARKGPRSHGVPPSKDDGAS